MDTLPDLLLQALASRVVFAPDGTTRPLESNVSREEAEALYSAVRSIQRFIRANRAYQICRDFSSAISALTLRQRSTVLASRFLKMVPGTRRVLNPSVLDPWSTFRLKNLVFLKKVQDDSRNWRFHRQF
jgi:hypothetical protein